MQKLEDGFVALNKLTLIVLLAAMAVIVFANVVMRYLTNGSIVWAEEVARYMMIWMTFLGAGLVLRYGGHVAITNLSDLAPPRMQRGLRLMLVALMLVFCLIFVWRGIEYGGRMHQQVTPATRISFSYVYAAIPAGFALMAMHLLLIARAFIAENRFELLENNDGTASLSID